MADPAGCVLVGAVHLLHLQPGQRHGLSPGAAASLPQPAAEHSGNGGDGGYPADHAGAGRVVWCTQPAGLRHAADPSGRAGAEKAAPGAGGGAEPVAVLGGLPGAAGLAAALARPAGESARLAVRLPLDGGSRLSPGGILFQRLLPAAALAVSVLGGVLPVAAHPKLEAAAAEGSGIQRIGAAVSAGVCGAPAGVLWAVHGGPVAGAGVSPAGAETPD